MSTAKLFLLGSFVLNVKGKPVRLPTRKVGSRLAYLTVHGAVHNRERISSMFCGDSPEELARRSLRTALSSLRKELGAGFILSDRETIQLDPQSPLWVDVEEMEDQATQVITGNLQVLTEPSLYREGLLEDFLR